LVVAMSYQEIPGRYAMSWILEDALLTTPPGGIWVEVGVALGRGIAEMARRLIDAGRDDVKLYAVDPWNGTERNGEQQDSGPITPHGDWALFLRMMQAHAPDELARIHILRAPSVDVVPMFPPESVDLVILDGDHRFPAVVSDIREWVPRIRRPGVLAGDDHNDFESPGVPRALAEIFGPGNYEIGDENGWATWRKKLT
jgi:hypothetical protein